MKNCYYLLLLMLGYLSPVYAQDQTINGNIYMGLNDVDPVGYQKSIFFRGNSDNCFIAPYNISTNVTEFRFNIGDDLYDDKFVVGVTNSVDGLWYPQLTVAGNGYTGIGTNTPTAYLDIAKPLNSGQLSAKLAHLYEGDHEGAGTYLGIRGYDTQVSNGITDPAKVKSFAIEHSFYGITNSSINFYRGGNTTGGSIAFNTDDNTEKMRIMYNGNVGVGTSAPDARLTVRGNVHATEVRVDLNIPAPDFVFRKSYELTSLADVEAYIKAKHHLPGIPSARIFEKDGVHLGEINMKLLQKIEELTLYVIQQQKELQAQRRANGKLNKRLKKLEHSR